MKTYEESKDHRVKILIVDDSPTQAQELEHLLEENGFEPIIALGGQSALEAARRRKPRLILSDIVMPEMDGYELCQTIKSEKALHDIPVILITSLSDSQDVIKGLECGADNFIRKSADPKQLISRIRYILASREASLARKTRSGVEIRLEEKTYSISCEKQQIADLLISIYEDAVHINEQLRAVNTELEAFSYSVSHDLRAPLRHIDGFSRSLLEDCGDTLDEAGRKHLDRILRASRRMSELIDDLLALSRVARGELRHEPVNLSEMAKAVMDNLIKTQPGRAVEFKAAPGLIAWGDGRLLRVALENLLGNAWKFTEKISRARIEFGAVEKEGRETYFVRDNGAGFDMTYAAKLFAPFQRLHSEEEFSGTGIGLATVKRIVHRHGGNIWAEGVVGKGAAVFFTV